MLTKMLVAVGFGAVMGLLNHIKRNKTIKKPKNYSNTFYPGFLTDVFYGALAALAAVLIAEPTEMGRVIILSIGAGYSGEGFILRLDVNNANTKINNDADIQNQLDADVTPPKQNPKKK